MNTNDYFTEKNKNITEKDIMLSACGINEETPDIPKSLIILESILYNDDTKEEQVIDNMILEGPIINIFRDQRNASVDIQFDCSTDPDFIRAVQMLKAFSNPKNSLDSGTNIFPIFSVTIVPIKYSGIFYFKGIYGSWIITSSQANRLPDTIKFIFNNSDFCAMRENESTINKITAPSYEE